MQTRRQMPIVLGVGALLFGIISTIGCGILDKKSDLKAFGQTCTSGAECESLQCAERGKVCTKACAFDSECGDGLVCRTLDASTAMQCSKAEGSKVGASCQTPNECDHGSCLKSADAPSDPGYCSRTCQTSSDCPDGFKVCQSISDGGSKMCLQGDGQGTASAQGKVVAAQTVGAQNVPTTATAANTTTPAPADAGSPAPTTTTLDAGLPPLDAGLPTVDAGGVNIPAIVDAGIPAILDAGTTIPRPTLDAGTRPRIKFGTVKP